MKILIYSVTTTQEHLMEFLETFSPEPHFDYVLLSTIDLAYHPHQLKVIKIYSDKNLNFRRQSRLAKMCPEKFIDLSGYDLTIYMDSNININREILLILDNRPVTLFLHNRRRYILSEILYCYYTGKMSFVVLLDCIIKSGALKMIRGLYQGGLIFRKVNHEQTAFFNNTWIETYNEFDTDRDQISLATTVHRMKKHVNVIQSVLHDFNSVTVKAHDKIVYAHTQDIVQMLFEKFRSLKKKLIKKK